MMARDIAAGLLVGLVGGGLSGLLGVSSGGILVPLAALILGLEQHVAQGVSLIAQVLPTSLGGVLRYVRSGHEIPLRWLALLSLGFVAGGCLGALLAGGVSDRALRWTYVGYLAVLWTIVALRSSNSGHKHDSAPVRTGFATGALIGVGALGGLSSGFLGIGGGLAITAGLTAALKTPQHQAQALSLAVTALPLTLPSALLYMRQGWSLPWFAILGLVIGLWIGAELGARFATLLSGERLRRSFLALIAAMAAVMAWKATQ